MKRLAGLWLILAAMVAGCGGRPPSSENLVGIGPHRGRLLKLPNKLGFAEVVVENPGVPSRSTPTEVAAYFLGPDAASALAPSPTDVSLSLYLAESKTREKVALKPSPDEGKSGKAGRFAAIPPPGFDGNIASGKLSAKQEGRDIDIPF